MYTYIYIHTHIFSFFFLVPFTIQTRCFISKSQGNFEGDLFFWDRRIVAANLTAVQAPPFPLNLPKASCWSPDGIALAMAIPAMFG